MRAAFTPRVYCHENNQSCFLFRLIGVYCPPSVQDATHDDLHRAGMKEGHIRRALKALDIQPNHHHQQHQHQRGAPSSAGRTRATSATNSFDIEPVDNSSGSGSSGNSRKSRRSTATSNNAAEAAAAAAKGGWVVRNPDGSIIFPPGVSCVLCEDDQGRRHRYVVAPSSPTHSQQATSATAASAAAGPRPIRRSISSGAPRGQAGGAGGGVNTMPPTLRGAVRSQAELGPDQVSASFPAVA